MIGYRLWRLGDDGVRSVHERGPWPGPELRASCPLGRHDPPEQACSCGVYAYYDQPPWLAWALTPGLISGAVIVWGRIEVHATGMRAARARIVGLELPPPGGKRRRLAELARGFELPVVPRRTLTDVALAHGRPLQPELRPARAPGATATAPPFTALPRTGRWALRAGRRWSRASMSS